jgi:hypothetical protein
MDIEWNWYFQACICVRFRICTHFCSNGGPSLSMPASHKADGVGWWSPSYHHPLSSAPHKNWIGAHLVDKRDTHLTYSRRIKNLEKTKSDYSHSSRAKFNMPTACSVKRKMKMSLIRLPLSQTHARFLVTSKLHFQVQRRKGAYYCFNFINS